MYLIITFIDVILSLIGPEPDMLFYFSFGKTGYMVVYHRIHTDHLERGRELRERRPEDNDVVAVVTAKASALGGIPHETVAVLDQPVYR